DSNNSNNDGVYLEDLNSITTTGTGTIDIFGQGGGTLDGNQGILIDSAGLISTQLGSISLTGIGGGAIANEMSILNNNGIDIASGQLILSNSGDITLHGTSGSGAYASGIRAGATISTSGTGAVSLTGQSGSVIAAPGSRTGISISDNISTEDGNITLSGYGTGGTGVGHLGVEASGSLSTVNGDITIIGQATGASGTGVYTSAFGSISSLTGNLSIDGIGTGANGVTLEGNTSTGGNGTIDISGTVSGTVTSDGISALRLNPGILSSVDGDITLTGSAQTTTGNVNETMGIMSSMAITSQSGSISLNGTAGGGSGTGMVGVALVSGAAAISTTSGSIELNGTGGTGSGDGSSGVVLFAPISTSSGPITITGTGGFGGGTSSHGVETFASIQSTDGSIHITGISDSEASATNIGISLRALFFPPGKLRTTGPGADIRLTTDSLNILLVPVQALDPTSRVIIENYSSDVPISLYASGTPGGLEISSTELDLITAGTLVIGNAALTSGDVTITASPDMSQVNGLEVYSGANISFDADIDSSNGGTSGDILAKAAGNIRLEATRSLTTDGGDVTFWSDADADNDGTIAIIQSAISTNGGNILFSGGSDLATGFATHMATGVGGGNSINTADPSYGILILTADLAAGTADVTLRGQSLGTAEDGNSALLIQGVGTPTLITGNNITIVGIADTAATMAGDGEFNRGISMFNTVLVGSGSVSMTGVGSTGTGGLASNGAGVRITNSHVGSTGADVQITGTGRGAGTGNAGVTLESEIYAATDVTITGTGSQTGTSTGSNGVTIRTTAASIY
ncbi:MAG: hypothetical protein KDA96_23775, partial [Planctomycetaceae bacterium]|nr:hypothetical protein [Planctomycetaceae bacterium]